MKCFLFSNGDKGQHRARKSASAMPNSTTSTDHDMRKPGSEFKFLNVTNRSADSRGRSPFLGFSQRPCNLRTFTFQELRNATRNFSHSLMLGKGGSGHVYRGTISSFDDSNTCQDVAIKQLHRRGLQGHKEWLNEVTFLGMVEHPNLVKLIGYCAEDDERGMQLLLVYEFMPNRSVENHLSTQSTTPLSWAMRLRIALDAARGLTYLHEETDFQIIFRDLKASNILLDEHWNAKLSDFGLARQGPKDGLSHVSTAAVGTIGYAAPEYIQTGRLTVKCDIWGYGVVLYELITGRRAMDRSLPKAEQRLLDWVKPYKSDTRKLHMIIDPRLVRNYSLESVTKLVAVANRCLARHPKSRPKMSEVLKMVQSIIEKSEIGTLHPQLRSSSEEATSKECIKRGMNSKRTGDLKVGEGRRLAGQRQTPKLVRRP